MIGRVFVDDDFLCKFPGAILPMQSLPLVELVSLALLLVGIGLAFSDIHLSGWVLGWILLSGALMVQWFRSIRDFSHRR